MFGKGKKKKEKREEEEEKRVDFKELLSETVYKIYDLYYDLRRIVVFGDMIGKIERNEVEEINIYVTYEGKVFIDVSEEESLFVFRDKIFMEKLKREIVKTISRTIVNKLNVLVNSIVNGEATVNHRKIEEKIKNMRETLYDVYLFWNTGSCFSVSLVLKKGIIVYEFCNSIFEISGEISREIINEFIEKMKNKLVEVRNNYSQSLQQFLNTKDKVFSEILNILEAR